MADPKMRPTPDKKIRQREDKMQRKREQDPLDKGLADTFPASDPVEATQPAPTPEHKTDREC
jgi:hypothetical protein